MPYRVRSDGLIDLQLPNGMWTPTAVPEQQLQAMGVQPLEIQGPVPDLPGQPMLAQAGAGGAMGEPLMSSGDQVMSDAGPQMSMAPEASGMGGAPMVGSVPAEAGSPNYGVPKKQPSPGLSLRSAVPPGEMGTAPPTWWKSEEQVSESAPEPEGTTTRDIQPRFGQAYPVAQQRRYASIPEREMLAARTVQKGVQIPPEALDAMKEQWLTQDAATMGAAAQARERLEPVLVEREKRLMQEEDDLKAEQARRREVNRRLQEQEREITNQVQELEKVKNPTEKRYWAENGGIGARLLAAVSIAAGGIVQGLKGGQNPGLVAINSSIERWIEGEEREYNRKKGAVDEAKNDYAAALNRYGTPEAAREWLRAKGHTLANNMLENRLKLADVRGMEDEANQVIQEQKNQRNQFLMNLFTIRQDRESQSFRTIPAHSVQVGGPPAEDSEDRKRRVRLADGTWGYVRGTKPSEAYEVQGKVNAYADLRAISQEMERIISSVRVPGTKERRQIDALFNTAAKKNEQFEGMGVLREGDYERAKTTFGDPDAFFKFNPKEGIRKMVELYDQGYSTIVSNNVSRDPEGWQPVSDVSMTNPTLDVRSDQ